jgi:hypothetical protein
MLGHSVRSSSIVYPPVVPLLTKASVAAFGLTNGVSLLGAVASLAPGTGVYGTLRYVGIRSGGLLPALLVLCASSVGEATAWGGYPQLIGLGLAPITLVLYDRLLRTWRARDALIAGVALMAVLATSHFIGLVVVVAMIGVFAASLIRPSDSAASPMTRFARLGVMVLPSLWLAPLYWSLARAFDARTTASPNPLTWSSLLDRIEFLYRDAPWLWRVLLVAGLAAPLLLVQRHKTPLWRLTAALFATTTALVAVTREGRFLYMLTPTVGLAFGLWAQELGTRAEPRKAGRGVARAAVTATTVILLGGVLMQGVRSSDFFGDQRRYYGILTPELVGGLEYLRSSTDSGAVVAVPSLGNATLGWWVEAIGQRPTIYGSPLGFLIFDDEIRRASLANDLFLPPFPTADRIRKAADNGIDVILLPTAWTFYDAATVGALQAEAPDGVVVLNEDVVVIRVNSFLVAWSSGAYKKERLNAASIWRIARWAGVAFHPLPNRR